MVASSAKVRGSELVGRALADQGVTDLFFMMGIGGPHSPPVRSCIEAGSPRITCAMRKVRRWPRTPTAGWPSGRACVDPARPGYHQCVDRV